MKFIQHKIARYSLVVVVVASVAAVVVSGSTYVQKSSTVRPVATIAPTTTVLGATTGGATVSVLDVQPSGIEGATDVFVTISNTSGTYDFVSSQDFKLTSQDGTTLSPLRTEGYKTLESNDLPPHQNMTSRLTFKTQKTTKATLTFRASTKTPQNIEL